MGYEWDFTQVVRSWDLLAQGAVATLELTAAALVLSVPVGLLFAVVRMARIPVLSALAVAYIEFFRLSAGIVLVYWFYFAAPVLFNISLSSFWAAMLAIGLQASAFFAEIFRGGIEGVPQGQREAAKAVGLGYRDTMRYVVLPQALRNMLPVCFARLVDILKNTSLAASITYSDIVFQGMRVSSLTYRPIETWTIVGAIFFVFIFITSLCSRYLEQRLSYQRR